MEEVAAYHNTRSTFTRLTVNDSNVPLILLQPFCHIFTKRLNISKLWRVVILEWVVLNSSVEFGRVIKTLRAQIVDFEVILKLENSKMIKTYVPHAL